MLRPREIAKRSVTSARYRIRNIRGVLQQLKSMAVVPENRGWKGPTQDDARVHSVQAELDSEKSGEPNFNVRPTVPSKVPNLKVLLNRL
jgi:hypothetical protein